MYQALYDFWITNVFNFRGLSYSSALYKIGNSNITLFGTEIRLIDYVCFLLANISIFFIVVFACLFVYKIIKLIGGLIR